VAKNHRYEGAKTVNPQPRQEHRVLKSRPAPSRPTSGYNFKRASLHQGTSRLRAAELDQRRDGVPSARENLALLVGADAGVGALPESASLLTRQKKTRRPSASFQRVTLLACARHRVLPSNDTAM
jgi:hypothetical protein